MKGELISSTRLGAPPPAHEVAGEAASVLVDGEALTSANVRRFRRLVGELDERGCRPWQGALSPGGYGRVNVGGRAGRRLQAHRVAFALAFNQDPVGLVVCHRCDHPRCVNADHLFLGTQADNIRDAQEKGRIAHGAAHGSKTRPERVARGERHGASRLTAEQVRDIRRAKAAGERSVEIATRFGVSRVNVDDIAAGRRWASVPWS
jgi:hypothetical protein